MVADPSKHTQNPEQAIETTESHSYTIDQDEVGRVCLADMRACIRQATDELVRSMGYKIKDVPPQRVPGDAVAGVIWGYSLLVERLEEQLADLQNAVVDDSMTAQNAVERAQQAVLVAARELRYGAHFHSRYFGVPHPLPPAAELGRICAIVERLADELASLGDRCGSGSSRRRGATIRIHMHPDQ